MMVSIAMRIGLPFLHLVKSAQYYKQGNHLQWCHLDIVADIFKGIMFVHEYIFILYFVAKISKSVLLTDQVCHVTAENICTVRI